MAKIYPDAKHRNYDDMTIDGLSAEKIVCEFIENSDLDDRYIGIFNQYIDTRKLDLILIIPEKGVLVIEIKAYSKDYLIEYNDNFKLVTVDGKELDHPYDQAKKYSYTIIDKIKKDHDEFISINGMCKVASIIAMPNLYIEDYCNIGLDMACCTDMLLSKEDFLDASKFITKIKGAINYAFKRINGSEFDDEYYETVSSSFLPSRKKVVPSPKIYPQNVQIKQVSNCVSKEVDEQLVKTEAEIDEIFKLTTNKNDIGKYSKLRIISDLNELLDEIPTLSKEHLEGTKIHIIYITACLTKEKKQIEEVCAKEIKEKMEWLCNTYSAFLFSIHCIMSEKLYDYDPSEEYLDEEFVEQYTEIIDGLKIVDVFEKKEQQRENYEECLMQILECANHHTFFNFNQYVIEHYPVGKPLTVIASAGTGKTYAMIGRISFLIHKEILEKSSGCKVHEIIFMMTFTNNSTNEMRIKLYEHYIHYFILTKKSKYMDIIEQIGCISIRTINSMAKQLISKHSSTLGLSSDFKVKSGVYDKRNILKKCIQKELEKSEIKELLLKQLQVNQIENILESLINFMNNRSIVFNNHNGLENRLNDPYEENKKVKDFFENVIRAINAEYMEENRSNNFVAMNEIIILLDLIRERLDNDKTKPVKCKQYNKYLFIDEFQDTDNKQINLISYFAKYYDLNLFVVGDKKQCIYGFRGADDSSFKTLSNLHGKSTELSLVKNYRTDMILMKQFNELFSKWNGDHFRFDDKLIAQKEYNDKKRNINEIYFGIEHNGLEELKRALEKQLDTLVNDIETKEKIAILVRKNSEVEIIRRFSQEFKHIIEFDSGGQFYAMDAIIDFYKLVLYLIDDENNALCYNLSTTPYCKQMIPREYVFDQNFNKKFQEISNFDFQKYIKEFRYNPALKVLKKLINDNKPWERYMPEEFDGKLLSEDDFLDVIESRKEYRQHLNHLFQIFIENNATDYVTINKIQKFLEINILTKQEMELFDEETEDARKNKIVCTTVHKSKGLEFDTVILPFCKNDISKPNAFTKIIENYENNHVIIDYSLFQNNFQFKFESKDYKKRYDEYCRSIMSEELRILYVAITRAKRRLIYFNDTDKNTESTWLGFLNMEASNANIYI